MRKFKDGDKVVFVEEQHSQDYTRDYIPLIGTTGVIRSFIESSNEYLVLFENANTTTFCYEGELESIKSIEYIDYCNNDVSVLKTTKIIVDDLANSPNVSQNEMNRLYDLYVKGEWNNMKNEVLTLWYTRKCNKIKEEYEENKRKFNESKKLVIEYKEIIDRFENELEELYNSEENMTSAHIVENLNGSIYKYNINYDKLSDEFINEYIIERDNKLRELDELKKEINAQLSLSSDLEYQVEVLTRYGVLNKKTKKMVD